MKNILSTICMLFIANFFIACGGGGGGDEPTLPLPPPPPEEAKKPGSFSLVSPANQAKCVESRTHTWSASQYATSYKIKLVGSDNNTLYEKTISSTSIDVPVSNLPDNTAYTWSVIAINKGKETSANSIFSASTPGLGIVNFIPSILSFDPQGSNNKIAVKVSDAENETMTYSFWFDKNEITINGVINDLKIDTDDNTREFDIENVSFISGETYHLKISIKDLSGNVSTFSKYYNF